MQYFLMSVPEMERFAFRLEAISASKFERSPNRFEGHRLLPSATTALLPAVLGRTYGRLRPSRGGQLDALHLLIPQA